MKPLDRKTAAALTCERQPRSLVNIEAPKTALTTFTCEHFPRSLVNVLSISWGDTRSEASSSPLIPSLDPRGPRAPGRCLRLTDTHRLIDGEPDALWDWEAEAGQCS